MPYRLLRALHGYSGLALAVLLAIYAASGFLIAHGTSLGTSAQQSERVALPELASARPLDAARARALALLAAERVGLRGALAKRAKPGEAGAWRVHVERVARSADVTLRPAEGSAELEVRSAAFGDALKGLHFVTAKGAGGARLAWAIAVDLLSLALIGFAVTGLLLFFALKRDRRLGLALLAASSLYTLGSILMLAAGR